MHPTMFNDSQWHVMIIWYTALTSICGGLLLLTIVKSGYKYTQSALNPGIRVSFIEDIQRTVLAMGIIALAPTLLTLLAGVNDGLVGLCGQLLNHFVGADLQTQQATMDPAGMFETIIAAPFKTIIDLVNLLFGLKDLDQLIFNGQTHVFGSIMQSVQTGNVLADVILNIANLAFDIYFNAVYTIREWMIIASLVATPFITWMWVLSGQRMILELLIAEVVQTIFMQFTHAFALGIFMSIAGGGSGGGNVNTGWLSGQLVHIGVFAAGFGGSVCAAVLVVMGIRLIIAHNEEARANAKEGIKKALISLVILGLCLLIASFLAGLLSGSWGVR